MRNKILGVIFIIVLLGFSVTNVRSILALSTPDVSETTASEIRQMFRDKQTLPPLNINIPTVIQMPVTSYVDNYRIIYEVESDTLQPYAIVSKVQLPHYSIASFSMNKESSDEANLHDSNMSTYVQYDILQSVTPVTENTVGLKFTYERPIETSKLVFYVDDTVDLPLFVTIQAKLPANSDMTVLVNRESVKGNSIYFPQTTSDNFIVMFSYIQPLRINEINFEESSVRNGPQYLRFLARPDKTYEMYSSPSGKLPFIKTSESGDLISSDVIPKEIDLPPTTQNILFKPPDADKDGIADERDNCPDYANSEQTDTNHNGRGDVCDDFDNDGVVNAVDNCVNYPNRLQQDNDGDGQGDACDNSESRFIEQFSFLPWVGIAVGFGIVILLFKSTLDHKKEEMEENK